MEIPLGPEQDKLGETGLALAESNFCASIKVGPLFRVSMWQDDSPHHWGLEHRDCDSPSLGLSHSYFLHQKRSLGCLSEVPNLALEPGDLLESKKRKMSQSFKRKMGQSFQCAVNSQEWCADYMQINAIICTGCLGCE